MTESTPPPESQPNPQPARKPFEPIHEDTDFRDMLGAHMGKIFLIANPESFEEGGLGPQITAGWYKAKLVGLGVDYLILATEFHHGSGKKATKEPVKQYLPVARIKRVSFMRTERLIHI